MEPYGLRARTEVIVAARPGEMRFRLIVMTISTFLSEETRCHEKRS